jgi:hypothetical protein
MLAMQVAFCICLFGISPATAIKLFLFLLCLASTRQ